MGDGAALWEAKMDVAHVWGKKVNCLDFFTIFRVEETIAQSRDRPTHARRRPNVH